MYLRDIKRHLRAGKHPMDIPDALSFNVESTHRTAYKIGEYVVKRNRWAASIIFELQNRGLSEQDLGKPVTPWKQLRKVGLRVAKHWIVGEWIIQKYYQPLDHPKTPQHARTHYNLHIATHGGIYWQTPRVARDETNPLWLDIHRENVGVDEAGRLYAFDW